MNETEPKDSTLEELKEKKKTYVAITIGLIVVVSFMIGISIYSTLKKGIDFFTFLPLFFLPMLFVNWHLIKKLNAEIKAKE